VSETVQITAKDGHSFSAYLAGSTGPQIVIAHEIFAVNASMCAVADWLAEQGFRVAVPNLFERQGHTAPLNPGLEEDRNIGMGLLKSMDEAKAVSDLIDTAEFISLGSKAGVAIIGYCMGGKLAYLAATQAAIPGISYYGVGITAALDAAKNLKAPVLIHLPVEDTMCPPQAQALVTLSSHDGVGHAFARRNSPAFVEAAAEVADGQTLKFIKAALSA
jgi:carboxymethylenebutenolidase